MTRTLTLKETSAGYTVLSELIEPVTEPTFIQHNGTTLGVLISEEDYHKIAPLIQREQASDWHVEQLQLLRRETEAYERMKPALLNTHKGKFVAILNGELVDSDEDEGELADRVYEQYGYRTILITEVEDTPKVYHMGGPEVRA